MTHHLVGLRPAIPILVVRIKGDGVAASEPRGGAAGREEDLVGGFPDVVVVEAFQLTEGPYEVVVLFGEIEAARGVVVAVVVEAGRGRREGTGVGLATGMLTHVAEEERRGGGVRNPGRKRCGGYKLRMNAKDPAGEKGEGRSAFQEGKRERDKEERGGLLCSLC